MRKKVAFNILQGSVLHKHIKWANLG